MVMVTQNTGLHFSMVIEWSDEDQAYIVSFPEWEAAGNIGHTHGDTYEEAVVKGHDMLDFMIQGAQEENELLPQPRVFAHS
jgi:predicted RNase H-like HicB family nuclease